MKVSKKFVKEYVDSFYGFGGQIDKNDLVDGSFDILDTTLNKSQIDDVRRGLCEFDRFLILIDGHGWGTAWIENAWTRQEGVED